MNLIKLESEDLTLIEPSKAQQIKATFEPMVKMLEGFESSYNQVIAQSKNGITAEIVPIAKRLRLDIAKVRIETAKLKDEQKAEYLRAGKAIQGVHNIIVWAIQDKENKLKDIETHFERLEKQRLEQLQIDRVTKLSIYVADANERDLASMEEDVWQAYLSAKKQAYEDRIQAEKQAELDRIEAEKQAKLEQERIRKENEKLKKEREALIAKQKAENEERERLAKIEREKREKEEAERTAKEQAERQRLAEIEAKKQAEIQARLDAERKESERLQAELKAKEQAERERLAQIEADREAELSKGDEAKFNDLINDLISLKTKYSFKSKANKSKYSQVAILLDKIISHIS